MFVIFHNRDSAEKFDRPFNDVAKNVAAMTRYSAHYCTRSAFKANLMCYASNNLDFVKVMVQIRI